MSIDTPRAPVNPWDEGDYRIYGSAVPAPDGNFWPAYRIERLRGIPNAPQLAVPLHEVR